MPKKDNRQLNNEAQNEDFGNTESAVSKMEKYCYKNHEDTHTNHFLIMQYIM